MLGLASGCCASSPPAPRPRAVARNKCNAGETATHPAGSPPLPPDYSPPTCARRSAAPSECTSFAAASPCLAGELCSRGAADGRSGSAGFLYDIRCSREHFFCEGRNHPCQARGLRSCCRRLGLRAAEEAELSSRRGRAVAQRSQRGRGLHRLFSLFALLAPFPRLCLAARASVAVGQSVQTAGDDPAEGTNFAAARRLRLAAREQRRAAGANLSQAESLSFSGVASLSQRRGNSTAAESLPQFGEKRRPPHTALAALTDSRRRRQLSMGAAARGTATVTKRKMEMFERREAGRPNCARVGFPTSIAMAFMQFPVVVGTVTARVLRRASLDGGGVSGRYIKSSWAKPPKSQFGCVFLRNYVHILLGIWTLFGHPLNEVTVKLRSSPCL